MTGLVHGGEFSSAGSTVSKLEDLCRENKISRLSNRPVPHNQLVNRFVRNWNDSPCPDACVDGLFCRDGLFRSL